MSARRGLLQGLALLVAALAGALLGRRTAEGLPDLARHAEALQAAADEMRVEPALLEALVTAESGGDERATSRAGARGLTQLLAATAREEAERRGLPVPDGERLLDDPALNLRLGAGYLARQLERFGSEPFALAAYNAGPTNVVRWRARAVDAPPLEAIAREAFAATRAYVARVLALRDAYRSR